MHQLKFLCLAIIIFAATIPANGQKLLNRTISIQVNRQRLDNVLEIISNKGDFYFSYNSNIIKKDSLVSFNYTNKTVSFILGHLFNETYEFKESGNYIIIRKAPVRLTIVTNRAEVTERTYAVAGYVYNEVSGVGINEASIYEKNILAATLTNKQGYFKIKLKSSKAKFTELTVSKEFYEDTTITIEPNRNQEVSVTLMPVETMLNIVTVSPRDYLNPTPVTITAIDSLPVPTINTPKADTLKVEKLGLSSLFLSAKQKVQSVNLKNFFTSRPIQFSLTPKLSTHGNLSAQVVNNFSFNLLGGYVGGTSGLEIGGLFNIDKKDAQYMQVAGLFNVVGGGLKGFQVAGLNNTVLDTVKAFQVAGISNFVMGKFSGFQVGGVYNHVNESFGGFQVAGVANFVKRKVSGVQVAGVANISGKEMGGVQIAGVVNYSKILKGLQIGVINIADSSRGFSIGLINIVFNGYHKLSFSTNEVMNLNVGFKTGYSRFYSILIGGLNAGTINKVYSFGYGFGSELPLTKRKKLTINPELSCQYLYLGSWNYTNLLNKFHLNFNVKLNKYFSLFAGPTFNVYVSDQFAGIPNYRFPVPPPDYKTKYFAKNANSWFGWNVGINIF